MPELTLKTAMTTTADVTFCDSTTCLKGHLKKKTKIGFQDRLSLNAGQK